jgi:hypothetical protein
MNYEEYTYTIHPAHHGDGYSARERWLITEALQAYLETRFPGLRIEVRSTEGAPTPTRGPVQDVIEEINRVADDMFPDKILERLRKK